MTEVEMKDWQKGYQLDYLKEITAEYDKYNSYTDSPFAQFKKNNVADFLDKGSLRKAGDAWVNITEAKVRSKITMHGTGPIIGYKEPGDVVIQNISRFTLRVRRTILVTMLIEVVGYLVGRKMMTSSNLQKIVGLTTLVVRLPRLQRFLAYSFVIQVLLSRIVLIRL